MQKNFNFAKIEEILLHISLEEAVRNNDKSAEDTLEISFHQLIDYLFNNLDDLLTLTTDLGESPPPDAGFEITCPLAKKVFWQGINEKNQLIFSIQGMDNSFRLLTVGRDYRIRHLTPTGFPPIIAKAMIFVIGGALINEIGWER